MNESKITVRYAKALFSLAKDKRKLEKIAKDARLIKETIEENKNLEALFRSPVITTSKKTAVLTGIFGKETSGIMQDFLRLVVRNGRENYIKHMLRNYLNMYRAHQGIIDAEITTAVDVSDRTLKAIRKKIARYLDAQIEMSNTVNAGIIGGFMLRFDDKRLDASVANQLNKVKRGLLEPGK